MLKILALVLLALAPGIVLSEEVVKNKIPGDWLSKAVMCNTQDIVVQTMEKYGEEPWIYMDGGSVQPSGFVLARFVISLNPSTRTWSVIEFYAHPDGTPMACLLGFGIGTINMNKKEFNKPKGIDL